MNNPNLLDEVNFDDEETAVAALCEKLADAGIPGFQAEFDPEEADQVGAFVEDALSEQDAADSDLDLMEAMSSAHKFTSIAMED